MEKEICRTVKKGETGIKIWLPAPTQVGGNGKKWTLIPVSGSDKTESRQRNDWVQKQDSGL
jgi:hypothetical protein